MRFRLLVFLALLLAVIFTAIPAFGQSTTVSGTITDAAAQVWINGTYRIEFYQGSANPPFYWNGAPFPNPPVFTGNLDGTGSFSGLSIPSNNFINPGGSQWKFTVCPAANASCFTQPVGISGGSQSVSGSIVPPAIQVSANAYNQPTAYADSEITGAIPGFTYFNLVTNVLRQCNNPLPCVWVNVGVGSAPVTSVFGRTGAVTAQSGDYTVAQVTNAVPNTTTVAGHALSSNVTIACGDLTNAAASCSTDATNATNISSGTLATARLPLALQNGTTATTQALGDTSTLIATDGFVFANGTGTGQGAQPILAISLSNNCPAGNTGNCVFTPANTQTFSDCNSTVASAVITCTGSHFTAADVGKRIWGWANCNAFQASAPVSLIAAATHATILTFTSATQISMSVNATGQISSTNTGCIIYGNPDDAGAAAVSTLVTNASSCPRVFLASTYYMFTSVPGFMSSQPPSCANLGVIHGASTAGQFGNVFYPAGFELDGRGRGPTTIFLPPGFPESGTCTNGDGGASCFYIPVGGRWSDLSFTTGGGTNVGPANATLFGVDGPAGLDNITCTNWDSTSSASSGFVFHGWVRVRQLDISGCGNIGANVLGGAAVVAIQLAVENQGAFGISSGGSLPTWAYWNLLCYDCTVFPSQNANNVVGIRGQGSRIKLIGGNIGDNSSGASGLVGYSCTTVSGCVLDVDSVNFAFATGNTTNSAITCTVACTNILHNVTLKSGATGHTYSDGNSGSVLVDNGGNTFTQATALFTGSLIADGHSVKGTCTGVVTASSTLGLYGTGPNETTTTCTSTTIGTGLLVSGARTLENLVVTAGTGGVNASSGVVTVMRSTAGGALTATTITCTIGTGTSCADGTHQVSVVDGDFISIQFTTQAADTLANVKAIVEWN